MKSLLLTLAIVLIFSADSDGSSEESKYKHLSEEGIAAIARNSQVIVRGKVIEHSRTYSFKGKVVTLEEGLTLAENSESSLIVEVAATVQIEKVLKGPVAGKEVTFKWKEFARTDCPHIPMRAPFLDGIWFTLNEPDTARRGHHVDWVYPSIQEKLTAAIERWEAEVAEDRSAKAEGPETN